MKLVPDFIDFVKKDFNWKAYTYAAVLLVSLLFLNKHYNWYYTYLNPTYWEGTSMLWYTVFYLSVYFIAAIPFLLIKKDYKVLKNPWFYLKSTFFIMLFGLTIGFYSYYNYEFVGLTSTEGAYIKHLLFYLKTTFMPLPFLILAKLTFDKRLENLYGISASHQHVSTYLLCLLALVPFVIAASYTAEFQSMYPLFKPWYYQGSFGMSDAELAIINSMAYCFHYVGTEWIFRGCLVIGMAAIVGRSAVVPMAVMYCAIHFGKPIGEAISSIFGGYILGALAYQTRHIWGGIVIHIGIALVMDFAGLFQHYCTSSNR